MTKLKAGFSKAEITTKNGIINDPLFAKVLILDNGTEKVVFISLDCICIGGGIGGFSDNIFPSIRKCAEKYGIKFVICGTTHTHTPYEMTCDEDTVVSRVEDAISDAFGKMRYVKIGYGVGHEKSFCINRTLTLKDGTASSIRQAHPCPRDEDIEKVAYYDDSVRVIKIDLENGSPFCVMFTYGCHPLLGYANNGVTANYPGVAERLVKQESGAEAMFFQSCGGDVTETDYKNYHKPKNCDYAGVLLGNEVLRVVKNIKTSDVDIKVSQKNVKFPLRSDYDMQIEKIKNERISICDTLGGCPLDFKTFLPLYMKYLISPEYPLGYAYEYMKEEQDGKSELREQDSINRGNIEKFLSNIKAMERLSKLATTLETLEWHKKHNQSYEKTEIDTEIAGIRIGKSIFVTAPVEPLSEIGRRVKKLSSDYEVSIIGYANGYFHYGAPCEVYNNGGYETIESMLSAEWESVYMNTVLGIINDIKE
ncbi:MAG: hypothetical protein IJO52_08445 [Clostridia bacterium]|nr:hypothetical protein [Clostridia bacterium]